jgi:hypothetical protein
MLIAVTLSVSPRGFGQVPFVNLDFEQRIPPLIPDSHFSAPITNALPGWRGYIGGVQVQRVVYDTTALDEAAISLHDHASPERPLAGNYSVFLQGSSVAAPTASAAIAQYGRVPSGPYRCGSTRCGPSASK